MQDDQGDSAGTASVGREGEAHGDFHEDQEALGDERGGQSDAHGEIGDAAERNQQDPGISGSSQ